MLKVGKAFLQMALGELPGTGSAKHQGRVGRTPASSRVGRVLTKVWAADTRVPEPEARPRCDEVLRKS
jgi:hypothetical protein